MESEKSKQLAEAYRNLFDGKRIEVYVYDRNGLLESKAVIDTQQVRKIYIKEDNEWHGGGTKLGIPDC